MRQVTEDAVGPYELHDFFLYHFLRYGAPPEKILFLANHARFAHAWTTTEIRRWLQVFIRRFFSNQFKRSCLPDGPKVGSISLSPRGDWRMPSDAAAALWLDWLSAKPADLEKKIARNPRRLARPGKLPRIYRHRPILRASAGMAHSRLRNSLTVASLCWNGACFQPAPPSFTFLVRKSAREIPQIVIFYLIIELFKFPCARLFFPLSICGDN
jgi:hypothetical protein